MTTVPLKLVMTSPALRPALAAAESSVTDETSTPSFVPKYSASCGDSVLTEIPSRFVERPTSSSKFHTEGGEGGRGAAGGRGGTVASL